MATNNCTNCGCTKPKCGCQDTMLTTPAPCPTPVGCPDPEPCSEVFDAQCVVYTGDSILCGQDIVVTTSSNVADALNDIVDYICQELPVSVTLTDAGTGTHQSLVNDGTGPALAVKGLKAGTGISVSSTSTDITITNTDLGSSVALTSAGGTETLVNDGTGPSLATKGITAGTGISLSSTATDLTVTNAAPDQVVAITAGTDISVTGTYPSFTITNDAPNVDQNIWATFAATTGSTTADTTTDTLTVVGTGGITTSISGDTLTIDGSGITSQFAYEIGQYVAAEGGVIAHRWLSTTAGGTPESGTVQNYIVVDTNDLSVLGAQWSSLNVNIPNVGSFYDGALNTANLIAAGPASGITTGVAAELCDTSTNNGKSDWYLPAIDELSKIFINRWEIGQGITVAGGTQFGYSYYWSSTQENVVFPISTAYAYSFTVGALSSEGKANSSGFEVRAVRRFSI